VTASDERIAYDRPPSDWRRQVNHTGNGLVVYYCRLSVDRVSCSLTAATDSNPVRHAIQQRIIQPAVVSRQMPIGSCMAYWLGFKTKSFKPKPTTKTRATMQMLTTNKLQNNSTTVKPTTSLSTRKTLNGHFALNSVFRRYVWSSEAWILKLGYS